MAKNGRFQAVFSLKSKKIRHKNYNLKAQKQYERNKGIFYPVIG